MNTENLCITSVQTELQTISPSRGNFFLIDVRAFLTLFRMGLFGAAHEGGGGKKAPSLKSVTHILQ